jgi:energy-converting hydrogenase Eha subunit A
MESVKSKPSLMVSGVISAAVLGLTFMPAAFPLNHSWQSLDRQVFPLFLLPGTFVASHVFSSKDAWSILLLNWLFYALLAWPLTGDFSKRS